MDKERARFILQSFRPDGADVNDADFADALKLALEDRELGEWLACERAFDAEFATALGTVPLPEHLRDDILAGLAVERGDFPQAEDSQDAAMIGALATIQPPAHFRDQILMAMDATSRTAPHPKVVSIWRRLSIPMAAAAGIALALFLTRQNESPSSQPLAETGRISAGVVQASFVKTYQAPDFTLEVTQKDYDELIAHLCDCGLPKPENLPPGLKGLKGIGCRELVVDGKHGSLICFDGGADGVIHLVVFKREDMMERGPFGSPDIRRDGEWTAARWQDEHRAFMLLGHLSPEKLASFF